MTGGVPSGAGEQARWLEELEHCWCPTHGYAPGCPVHEQIIVPRREPPAPSSLPDEEGAPAQDRIAQLEAELAASRAFSQALSAQLPHTTRVNFDEWVAEEGEAQARPGDHIRAAYRDWARLTHLPRTVESFGTFTAGYRIAERAAEESLRIRIETALEHLYAGYPIDAIRTLTSTGETTDG